MTGWPTITLARAVLMGMLGGCFAVGFAVGTMGFLWFSKRPVLDSAGRSSHP